MSEPKDAVREVAVVFIAIAVATVLVSWTPLRFLSDYRHLVLAALFLGVAVARSERQPDGLARYGLRLGGLLERADAAPGASGAVVDLARALGRAAPLGLRELAVALAVAAVVFPAFVTGFYLWHQPSAAFELRWPDAPGSYLLSQLLVVALPEEALFRGFFQGRLQDAWPAHGRILGARLSWQAWLLQAALFALLHLATELSPARLAVFFPGLLFGWLCAWRGGIGAAIVLHALCNLLADVLARSWF